MRRTRKKYDLIIVIFLALLTIGYFVYNHISAESRGIKAYSKALENYKNVDFETAYQYFSKVPMSSSLKLSALFRQARCATNMDKKELAIKKYKKIIKKKSKSSIIAISEYNIANLFFDLKEDNNAKKHFKNIIKKYPTSDYAIASEYYLGLIELRNLPEQEKKTQTSY